MTTQIYRPSLGLLTDLYQLTMANAFWKSNARDTEAVFNLFFRQNPFGGGYAIACGLANAIDYLLNYRVSEDDLAYLSQLRGNDGKALLDPAFLDELGQMRFSCDVDAMPEGTAAFPFEPLLRIRGPIVQCQLLETPLLNLINFQTLIATKAARVCAAAAGDAVLEFGLRRAHGVDGALSASRAAYVGGCAATSNTLAGKLYGIPVRGTHAHSWVMCFDDEPTAFSAYAEAMPNNCAFLVDTYNTLEGVRHAVETGRWLKARGHQLAGIRIDSGDLAYLSSQARSILDEAGFSDAAIIASNDLDEQIISSLKDQNAPIAIWGVGTRLVTGHGQAALGGVYKLAAIRRRGEPWKHRLKLSEQSIKISIPGVLQVRRYHADDEFVADAIWDEETGIPQPCTIVDPLDPTRRRTLGHKMAHTDLLQPVFRAGKLVSDVPSIEQARQRTVDQLSGLHSGIRRFVNPHQYPVGLELQLFELRMRLVLAARGALPTSLEAQP